MHREGEDAGVGFTAGGSTVVIALDWQPTRVSEDECRAVAVMNVEIDDRDSVDAPLLQDADGDGHVVERAEPLAVIGKSVVQPAADVTDDVKRRARGGRIVRKAHHERSS